MKSILLIAFLFLGGSVGLSPEVKELCDDYWQWRLRDMPEFATFVGVHDYGDQLDDVSEEAWTKRMEKCKEFLERAASLEATTTDHSSLVNLKVLKYELNTFIDGYSFKGFYLPINFLEGIQVDMEKTFDWMPKETKEDCDKMLARLIKLPLRINQTIDLMTKGMEQGITNSAISMKNMNKSMERFVVSDPAESPFYKFFEEGSSDDLSERDRKDIQTEAKLIIKDQVTPAFERLYDFVMNDYVPRKSIAVTSMSNGPQFYKQLLWFHTSTNKTAQEIHEIGKEEVKKIEQEMLKIVKEMGYHNMSVEQFSSMIRDDPKNFYDTSEEMVKAFEDVSYNLIPPNLPEVIKNIPTAELKVKYHPVEDGTGAYYLGPAYDGSRPGVFYVQSSDPKDQPKYTVLTLSLHEGNPGHHLQSAHSIENPDVASFRRIMEDRSYGLSPSRFPIYTYYMEGWGLYAESLGFDMDLYGDPLDRYGHYSEEIFRACRLVVDTGIHALGWSRQDAIDYMLQHSASTKGEIENEIDRYITWPGQALAYKIGERKIHELRSRAKEAVGEDAFDMREFHEVFLDSIGPLTLVEDEVFEWIDNSKD